jgi:ketosteroid isomerase-like protein
MAIARKRPSRTKRPKRAARRAKARVRKAAPRQKRRTPRATRPTSRTAAAGDGLRALAQRIVDVTLANDDEAAFDLYAENVESIEPGQPPMRGIDAIRQKFAGWRQMVTETRFEPRRVCVDGNVIVIEWLGHVTLAGSGKRAELHEVALHEIRDGKIVREEFFYNPAALA